MILKKLMILILLIGLTASFHSCKTQPVSGPEYQADTVLDMPTPPALGKVKWENEKSLGGMFLKYDQYRVLESNIIEYRRYIAELEKQVKYYRGDSLDK